MGFLPDQIESLHLAAMIHDVGKILLPVEILSRPNRLTDLEFGIIREHPQIGFDIARQTEYTSPIAQTILQHHERMNGSGYPNGIKGEDILIEARILAVADVVESMTSYRPYRSSYGIKKAIGEITCHAKVLYDNNVANACFAAFDHGFTFNPQGCNIGC